MLDPSYMAWSPSHINKGLFGEVLCFFLINVLCRAGPAGSVPREVRSHCVINTVVSEISFAALLARQRVAYEIEN